VACEIGFKVILRAFFVQTVRNLIGFFGFFSAFQVG
jgi:hypothetical protein